MASTSPKSGLVPFKISDDGTDNFIKTSDGSKKLKFKPEIVWSVIEVCQGISSVVIAIKSYPNENPRCELFGEQFLTFF